MDKKSLARFKKLLLDEKERLLSAGKVLNTELNISPDDLPDETDFAVSAVQQSLLFKLRDRERHLLAKIEVALLRVEDGSFGVCEDCEEPIERRRLEARPVSTMCIACKEREEHREKVYA